MELERPMGIAAPEKRSATRTCAWAVACSWLLATLLPSLALSQTTVGGAIATNTTWSAAAGPYLVNSDVVVQNGAQLIIEPGATVYVGAGRSISVQSGALRAIGTAAAKIVVTSDRLRTGANAAAGDWNSLLFASGTTNTRLEHVVVEYGSGVVVNGSAPTFNNVDIRYHAGPAVSVDLSASPSGSGNSATGNQLNAILVPAGDINGSVTWGVRGIPYLVASGTLSVGASPSIISVTPNSIEQGETRTLTVTGSRLTNVANAQFEAAGVTAQVLPGASATQAQLSVTATEQAALGQADLSLLVDAGKARRTAAINVLAPQFKLTSVAPTTVYVGQGAVTLNLTGTRFTSDAIARANGVDLPTTFLSATSLQATLPNQTATGALAISVRQPDQSNPSEYITSVDLPVAVATPSLALAPASATVISGTTQNLTLTLPYPAQSGGQTINLVSSVPSIATAPASVAIAEGQSSAIVEVTTQAVGSSIITASRTGFTSAQAVLSVVPPPTLTITPPSLIIGEGRTQSLQISSSAIAPAGGLTLNLTSSTPAVATVPATAVIPAGSSSASVSLSTLTVGTTTITANATGHVNGSSVITVRPVSINFPAGALVAPGLSRTVPLTLSDPAPAGGLEISLVSSNAGVVTVPATVTVPTGQSAANITLTGVAIGNAEVTATASGYQTGTLPVTVDAVNISLGVTTTSLPANMTHQFTLTLSRPAPAGGVSVALTTGNSATATVSPSVIEIAEGQTSGALVRVALTGVAAGTTTMSASAPGLNSANVAVTVTAAPVLQFARTSTAVGKGMQTYVNEIALQLRTGTAVYTTPNGVTITLSNSDPSRASVPETVTVAAGQNTVSFAATGIEYTSGTPVTIDATAPGFSSPATKLSMNVISPTISIQSLETTRSPAGQRDPFGISLTVPGANWSTSQSAVANMPFDLSIVDANPVGIIEGFYSAATGDTAVTQIVVAAGRNDSAVSPYVGVPTVAGTYRVQVSGHGSTATSSVVNVSAPELRFSRATTAIGKGMQTYVSELTVTRVVNGSAFSGASPVTVTLVNSDPTRVSVPATVTIAAGQSAVSFYGSGLELTAGTPVTIDATAEGYTAPPTKLSVNVIPPSISIQSLETARSPAGQRDPFGISLTVPGANWSSSQTAVAELTFALGIVNANPAGIVDGFYSAATGGTAVTQIVVPTGRNDSTVSPYVGVPNMAGTYQVQVSGNGSMATSGVVTVSAPELRFSRASTAIGKGMQTYISEMAVTRIVNGNPFNGASPVTINLTSSDPTRVSVPATVTIPAGQSAVSFYGIGVDFTSGTPVILDATAEGYTAPATKLSVNVIPPTINIQSLETTRSPASQRDPFNVSLTVPGANWSSSQTVIADMPLELAIVEANPAGIVDGFYSAATGGTAVNQIVIAAGRNDSVVAPYVGVPNMAGTYRVRVSGNGATANSSVVTVSAPDLAFNRATGVVGKGLRTYVSEVAVLRSVGGQQLFGAAPLTVNLSCSSTAICSVPATVTIPANADRVTFLLTGLDIGTTTVTATAVGYNSIQDLNVNVIEPTLVVSGLVSTRAVGQTDAFNIQMTTPGANWAGNQTAVDAIVINLTSSAPDVGTVPSTVTIAAGATDSPNATFTATGAGTTTVTASHPGFKPGSGSVTVTP